MSKTVRRPKPKTDRTNAQVAALIADVEALKSGMNEVLARLAKVEVVKAGPQEPAPEEPQAHYTDEAQKPETE